MADAGTMVRLEARPPEPALVPGRDGATTGAGAQKDLHPGELPPRRLPVAPGDPTLAASANAQLRAEVVRGFQRGIGNQAVQAMVAPAGHGALAGTLGEEHAPGVAPRPGPSEPALEPFEATEEEPAAELPPPAPLEPEPLRLDYVAPPTLAADATSFPRRPGDKADARSAIVEAEARASATHAYSEIRSTGESLHRDVLGETNRAMAEATDLYESGALRLEAFEDRSVRLLDGLELQAGLTLDQSAESSQQRLHTAHSNSRRAVLDAVRQAHGRIGGLDTYAEQQGVALITSEQERYTAAIKEASEAVKKDAESAGKSLDDWKTKLADVYPDKGDALHIAYAEARRKAGPGLADQDHKNMTELSKKLLTDFTETQGKLTAGVETALKGPLDKSRSQSIAQGRATIEKAKSQALAALDQQLGDASLMLEGMRRSGHDALHARSRATKARLSAIVRAHRVALRNDASRTLEVVQSAAQPALRLYAASPDRFAATLRGTAPRGAEAMAQAARSAPASIQAAMLNARRLHSERMALNAASMQGMVTREEQECAVLAEEQLSSAQQQLGDASAAAGEEMTQSVASEESAFALITAGVHQTAESWAQSFQTSLAANLKAYGDASEASFEIFMTGATKKPLPVAKGKHVPPPAPAKTGEQKAIPFNETKKLIAGEFAKRNTPTTLFEEVMARVDNSVQIKLKTKAANVGTAIDNGKGGGITGPLRGISAAEGGGISQLYTEISHTALDEALLLARALGRIDDDDYHAAIAYLRGNSVEGAKFELKASLGFWSDDKERIEATMRALTPAQIGELNETSADTVGKVRSSLRGTDLDVFEALDAGKSFSHARADALRALDKVDSAKREGKSDEVNAALEAAFAASAYEDKEKADQHRKDVEREFAAVLAHKKPGEEADAITPEAAAKQMADYVVKPVDVEIYAGEGQSYTVTMQLEGANKDLAVALINEGADSVAAKAAKLGVEYQRPDEPNFVNLEKVIVDPRLKPGAKIDPAEVKKAQEEREAVLRQFATTYAGVAKDVDAKRLPFIVGTKFGDRVKDNSAADDYAYGLIHDPYPTAETNALGMQFALHGHWRTNKDLVKQIAGRLDKDEVQSMRTAYRDPTKNTDNPEGKDLYEELGVFHKGGFFTALSGDDRLEVERLLHGQPRNDQEAFELALFTIEQQRDETGAVGKFLAGGSFSEAALEGTRADLLASVGGKAELDEEGRLRNPETLFGSTDKDKGKLRAGNREQFEVAIALSQTVAQNYAARIDAIASSVTSAIAIIGAVVAAVVTVATGGAAAPLLLGAIALASGLTGMAAHRLISGGRYGWHQAAMDLGITVVQALSAGVGAQLGLLSRGGIAAVEAAEAAGVAEQAGLLGAKEAATAVEKAEMGQILGSKLADMALIGVTTGTITGAGQALFNEKTWEKGGLAAVEALMEGAVRGALVGLATALASQAVEGIPIGKLTGAKGDSLGGLMSRLGSSQKAELLAPALLRGTLKAASSSVGAMAGKTVEIGWEKAAGRFKGNAAEEIVGAGKLAALQGALEGAAEAPAARFHAEGRAARAQAIREDIAAARAGEQPKLPAMPAIPEPVAIHGRVPPLALPERQPMVPHEPELQAPPRPQAPTEPRAAAPARPAPEAEARLGPPRTPLPPEQEITQVRPKTGFDELPDQTVIVGPNPRSFTEANEIYGNVIVESPHREAAIYVNPETGRYMVVQGEQVTVAVGRSATGELEAPQPSGVAQRWKEVLDHPDTGRWELVSHFHPADKPGGVVSLPQRMPSGTTGDFGTLEGESALSGGLARQSRIHYREKDAYGYTDFGYDPASPRARYWVDYADPVAGGRNRVEFASIDEYREWFQFAFKRSPESPLAGRAPAGIMPPGLPESGPPPKSVTEEIDRMLRGGVGIEHPPADEVARAQTAFKTGTATANDFETLLKKAAADARTMLATSDVPHPSFATANHEQYVFDLAALGWYCLRGACGIGRDNLATSLGTFLMDAQRPATIQRYQAMNVFEAGQHTFAVVGVEGAPRALYLLDPTFGQFMRPPGRTFQLDEATANFLREHPQGAFMARDLLRDGYIPLTEGNAALYARAMGVPEAQAAEIGARLFRGDRADLAEQIGGAMRRPPVTRITSNLNVDAVEDLIGTVGQRMNELIRGGPADEETRQHLEQFRERLNEAAARGPVLSEQETQPTPAAPGTLAQLKPPQAVPPRTEPSAEEIGSAGKTQPSSTGQAPTPSPKGAPAEPGSGDLGPTMQGIVNAMERLPAMEPLKGIIEPIPDTWPPRYTVSALKGTVIVALDLMPATEQVSTASRFEPDPASGGYTVLISRRARGVQLERDLAHALVAIRAGHGAEARPSVLRSGGVGKILSPEDQGSLAELAVLGQRMQETTDQRSRDLLQLQAEKLISDLALTGSSKAADNRRAAALAHAELPEQARLLLERASEESKTNPYLLELSGKGTEDLALLEAALRRIGTVSDASDSEKWHRELAIKVAQSLIDRRVFAMKTGGPSTDIVEFARLLGLPLNDAVNALNAPKDPLQRLFARARRIAYDELPTGGMAPSDSRKPTAGFEAEVVSAKTGKLVTASPSGEFRSGSLKEESLAKPSGEHIDDLLQRRKRAMGQYEILEGELADKMTPVGRRNEIQSRLAALDREINLATEELGMAAGREFARLRLGDVTEIALPRGGAGVTDLVFVDQNGRFFVIECKGGSARLGTRLDSSGRFLVQQGTIEYLKSLADDMASSSDGAIRDLGEKMQIELQRDKPRLEYLVVRQPLTEDGRLASPEFGRFDLSANQPR
jgi:hypothetical protein